MAFGFPAYAEDVGRYDASGGELLDAVDQALEELGWDADYTGPSSLSARVGANWLSWGERVSIDVRDGKVRVRSECVLPTQCIDWGKNRKNVDRLLDRLDLVLSRSPAVRRAAKKKEPSHEQGIQHDRRRGVVSDRPAASPAPPPADPRPRPRDDADG
jgi:hypothetical protein